MWLQDWPQMPHRLILPNQGGHFARTGCGFPEPSQLTLTYYKWSSNNLAFLSEPTCATIFPGNQCNLVVESAVRRPHVDETPPNRNNSNRSSRSRRCRTTTAAGTGAACGLRSGGRASSLAIWITRTSKPGRHICQSVSQSVGGTGQ